MAQKQAVIGGLAKGVIVMGALVPLLRHAAQDAPFPMVMRQEELPKLVAGPPARTIHEELAYAIVLGAATVALLI